ncbi:MAG: glycosyltransferase family 4 protein [Actinobacteria bacterium]|nr:glycosyltransferase family 4 protein [Actinomycetota bacterium]
MSLAPRSESPRVLVWNQYFPPDTSATASLLAQLVDRFEVQGVGTHVVQGNPSYRPTRTFKWKPWELWRRGQDGTVVHSAARSRARLIDRALNYLTYTALSFLVALRTRCDVILVMTDPPIAVVPAVLVGKLRRKRVVYWLQDYHPEFMVGIGRIRPWPLVRVWSWAHRWALRRCDLVIAIGRDMRDRLETAGVRSDHIEVVANGSSVDWSSEAASRTRVSGADKLVVLHAGEIGMRGAWEALVAGARDAADVASLVLLGDGVDADWVRELTAGSDAVTIEPRLPWLEYTRRLLDADVLITMVRRGAEGYSVPSKTYELFGCARPIIVIADPSSEPARLVTELDCGFVVSPDDGHEFAAALRALAADPGLRERLGANALKAKDAFRRDDQLDRVVALVTNS